MSFRDWTKAALGRVVEGASNGFRSFVGRIVDESLAHPWRTLLLIGAVTAIFGYQIRHFSVDTTPESVALETDPALKAAYADMRRFGVDHPVAVAIETADLFSVESLGLIDRLGRQLEAIPGVVRVTSVLTAPDVRSSSAAVGIGRTIERAPATPGEAAVARAAIEANPLAALLLSRDRRATAILVEHRLSTSLESRRPLIEAVRGIVRRTVPPSIRAETGGIHVLTNDLSALAAHETALMCALVFLLAAVLLRQMLRNTAAVLTPLLECGLVVIWTLGLIFLAGKRASVMTILLPVELMVIALSDTIHVYGRYYDESARHGQLEAIRRAVRLGAVPCFFTCLTAGAGFLSLLASDVKIVREFGVFAAIGINFSFILLLTLVPALAALSPPVPRHLPAEIGEKPISRAVDWVIRFVPRDRGSILIANLVFLLIAGVGIARCRTDFRLSNVLAPEDALWAPHRYLEERFGGLNNLTLALETGAADGAIDPDVLRRAARFEAFLASEPDVSSVRSISRLLAHIRARLGAGPDGSLPETAAEAAQYLLVLEMAGASSLVNRVLSFDGSRTLVVAQLPADYGLEEYRALRARLAPLLEDLSRPGLRIDELGYAVQARHVSYLIESQVQGIVSALALVTLIISLLLQSWRLGLFSLLPNVQPIVAIFAAMGFLGIPITPYTVMAPGIVIGLAVDDTIHALSHFVRDLAAGLGYEEAVGRTLRLTGRASVYTSIAFAGATSVLLLSRIAAVRWCAAIIALALAAGIVAELFVLPKCLLSFRAFVEREAGRRSVRMGCDPRPRDFSTP